MRVLLLSWEYPPYVYGGLGRHVDALSRALATRGHEVHVVANGAPGAPARERRAGVLVHRAPPQPAAPPDGDWIATVLAANTGLLATTAAVLRDTPVDVLHAHDWLVAHAALGARRAFALPLVATLHATERGRHQGWLPGPANRFIDEVEAWLAAESERVIVCSRAMRRHVRDAFAVPATALERIVNGVAAGDYRAIPASAVAATRASVAAPHEHLVVAAGRLEYEKGIHVLVRALRRVRRAGLPARLAVAGAGTYEQELRALAARLRVEHAVTFLGFLEQPALVRLYRAADAVAVPSIYEPFGLSALEAMAAGTALVAGRTGGLEELVDEGRTGLFAEPGDTPSLAAALATLLTRPALATRLARSARAQAAGYDWDTVAARTAAAYRRALRSGRRRAGATVAAPPAAPIAQATGSADG